MSLNVKKGDTVLIIAGKDKGQTGKVLSCDPEKGRVVVEDCNIIIKHSKPRGANEPGGRNKMAGPIDVSNVQIVCPDCHKATRVGHKIEGDKKVRVCQKCGAALDKKPPEKKPKKGKDEKAEKDTVASEESTKKPAAKKSAKKEKKVASPEPEKTESGDEK